MAELLIKANKHWMDDLTQAEVAKLTDKDSYNSRSQMGDVVVVRPDGWKWGKAECLPDFIIVKIPDMSVEEAKKYEEPLNTPAKGDAAPKLLKYRKYQISLADVEEAKRRGGILIRTKALSIKNIKEKAK